MNKEQKDKLFEDNIDLIEMEFLRHVPEMQHRLGEMDRPDDNQYAIFEIPMNDIIPGLTVACQGRWDTKKIEITHYKIEETNEKETMS